MLTGRIRDLEKEWPFWAAFGGWFEFEPVLVLDKRSPQARWKRYGVPGETWIFIGRRRLRHGSLKQGRGDESKDFEVDVDALSDSELLGLTQSDTFEQLLQLSLMGDGDDVE